MRVLFLSQIVPFPPHGGVLQRGYNILRELGKRAEVHLLAFRHPDVLKTAESVNESRHALRQYCAAVEYFALWPKKSTSHRALALMLSAGSREPFSVIAHRSKEFQARVNELVGSQHFDAVHVDTVALAQFVDSACAVPVLLTHHNIESVLMERRSQFEGRLARGFLRREAAKLRSFEARVAPRFDVNVVVSRLDGQTLARIAPGVTTALVPNGVDVEYFAPDATRETLSLLYAGGMNMAANRDAVLYFLKEIWPEVRRGAPGVKFFVVGQDPPGEVLDVARRDGQVVVTGYVPDIRPFSRAAAVYVVPLRVGGGTRLKVLDAMAMGKALVTTSVGCEGLEVSPNQHVVVADTPGAFARETLSLLSDRDKRSRLGQAARELVERTYGWPVIADMLFSAYELASRAKRPRT
jgi:sugar transferase (PEP-CTERM/EpsH1 system associated)